jgi:hypothetical protein
MRYTNMAAIAAAFLLLGTISVALFSTPAGPTGLAEAGGPAPQAPIESWYFPAQYVNQGTGLEEPVHEYF